MCYVEMPATLYALAAYVERHQQEEHRRTEVIRNNKRQQNVGKGEKQEGEQRCVGSPYTNYLTADAVYKDEAVESEENKRKHNHYLHKVHSRQCSKSLVEKMERIEEKGKQRMTEGIVGRIPDG